MGEQLQLSGVASSFTGREINYRRRCVMLVLGKQGLVRGRQTFFGIQYVAEQEVAPLRALAIMFAKVAQGLDVTQKT